MGFNMSEEHEKAISYKGGMVPALVTEFFQLVKD
jgi:hypothetical protein